MGPRYVLVTFCNLPILTTSPVLCLRIASDLKDTISYAPVHLGYPYPMGSATGLARWMDKIFVLCSTITGIGVAVLSEEDLTPLFYQDLPQVKDGHSIFASETGLYVVSTGTDEVFCYDISDNHITNSRVVWRASTSQVDTHHVNSITEVDDELYISAFGPKTGPLWASAANGYIHNITQDIRVKEGIYHPHSLSERNEQLYYCESHMGSFCNLDGSLFLLDGYSRGVSWLSDKIICLATSVGRKISKSTGHIGNPADPGEKTGQCSLTMRNISSGELFTEIDLSWFGPEIYDLMFIESTVDLLKTANSAHLTERQAIQTLLAGADEREKAMRSQIAEQNTQIAEQNTQIAEQDAQIAEQNTQIAEQDALIQDIENRTFYKLHKKYTRFIEKVASPGTKRRRLYSIFINALHRLLLGGSNKF